MKSEDFQQSIIFIIVKLVKTLSNALLQVNTIKVYDITPYIFVLVDSVCNGLLITLVFIY